MNQNELDLPTQRMIWAQDLKIKEASQIRSEIQNYEPKFNVVNVDEILKLKP